MILGDDEALSDDYEVMIPEVEETLSDEIA